jgi:hypothetical protein
MKLNKMIKLLTVLTLLAITPVAVNAASSATATTTSAGGTNSLVSTNGVSIYTVTILNSGAVSNYYTFFDAPSTLTTWTNTPYTNVTTTIMTTNLIYTNILGGLETNTYPTLAYITNSTWYSTNNFYRILGPVLVPPGQVTLDVSSPAALRAFQGVLVTNTGAGSVTITYSPYK